MGRDKTGWLLMLPETTQQSQGPRKQAHRDHHPLLFSTHSFHLKTTDTAVNAAHTL